MSDIHSRYIKATEWLFERTTSFHNAGAQAYKPGLTTIITLTKALGSPQLKYSTIHVGGTNGKGSVSSLIASVLQEAGHTVGLYTSPHLVDFRERIRVNGQMISEEGVVGFLDRYRALGLDIEPSFFELTTAMAFDWFATRGCDCAVIEVGLGGRLDSTNIITPRLSVVTNISLDHTDLLGSTPAEIASEKAGIIKDGVPVVVGRAEGEVREVFARAATVHHAPIVFAQDHMAYGQLTRLPGRNVYDSTAWGVLECPLTGDCQPENANTVLNALGLLPRLTADAVRRGFSNVLYNTGLAGRWMQIAESPATVCDTGHNPGGWSFLGPRLADIASRQRLHMVVGFVNDKDISTILDMMPRNACYYFTAPSVKRGRPADNLAALAKGHGLEGKVYPTVAGACAAARAAASPVDFIFIGGSTFVVADAIKELGIRN